MIHIKTKSFCIGNQSHNSLTQSKIQDVIHEITHGFSSITTSMIIFWRNFNKKTLAFVKYNDIKEKAENSVSDTDQCQPVMNSWDGSRGRRSPSPVSKCPALGFYV